MYRISKNETRDISGETRCLFSPDRLRRRIDPHAPRVEATAKVFGASPRLQSPSRDSASDRRRDPVVPALPETAPRLAVSGVRLRDVLQENSRFSDESADKT